MRIHVCAESLHREVLEKDFFLFMLNALGGVGYKDQTITQCSE